MHIRMNRAARRLAPESLEARVAPTVDILDVAYAATGNARHVLDLHLPDNYLSTPALPTVVWIHGGGWQSGDEDDWVPAQHLVAAGFAVASVGYRLTSDPGSPHFPDQIHDVKAAVRWLRGNAALYHLDPTRFAAAGSSAGGHLAALMGTSGGVADLEGTVGSFPGESSRVQAVVDFFGPADLYEMWQVPGYAAHGNAGSPESKLIGATLSQNEALADIASPVTYATADDPPFLTYHGTGDGTGDGTVPWQQSQLLHNVLTSAGAASTLYLVSGAGHSYGAITSLRPSTPSEVVAFLAGQLGGPATLPLDGNVALSQITNNPTLANANVTGYDYTLTRNDATVTTGVLLVPPGMALAPAVLLSHGAAGSVANARNFGITNGVPLAKAGYVVIAPVYEHAVGATTPFNTPETLRRASDGVSILLNIDAVDAALSAVELPSVRADQIAAFGNSKGAYLTVLLAQGSAVKPFLAAAGITAGGVRSGAGQSPPVADADLIDIPFVIQHAEDDTTVPFTEGQALFDNLRPEVRAMSVMQGYADLLLPGGAVQQDSGHALISARNADVFGLAVDCFNQWLGRDPQPARSGDDSVTVSDLWNESHPVSVLTNDPLPPGWAVTSVTQPGRGAVTLGPGTAVTYTYLEFVSPPAEPPFAGDDYFTYTTANAQGQTETARLRVQIRPATAPPRVEQAVAGDGTAQRSRVAGVAVTFTGPVTFPAGTAAAFRLERTGPGGPNGVVSVTVTGVGPSYSLVPNDPVFTAGGSFIDGTYELTVLAANVQGGGGELDGNGDGTAGDDFVFAFHRLFGDADGSRTVDALDFSAFRQAFGTSNSAFDFDGTGGVDALDFGQFRQRFGTAV